MPDITIVYWRDIPAQILVGRGRRAAKVQLPERFEQAIDRAAMKCGAAGTDDYLAQWRKGTPTPADAAGSDAEVAKTAAAQLDRDYDQDRIKILVDNDGWA
jgi:Virulence factor